MFALRLGNLKSAANFAPHRPKRVDVTSTIIGLVECKRCPYVHESVVMSFCVEIRSSDARNLRLNDATFTSYSEERPPASQIARVFISFIPEQFLPIQVFTAGQIDDLTSSSVNVNIFDPSVNTNT